MACKELVEIIKYQINVQAKLSFQRNKEKEK